MITTIGLEIHCELNTQSKIFCSCKNTFGGEPNSNICPICCGYPGVLPKLNASAVEKAIKAGLATNCAISKYSKWDRKNYFYPDLPKAWQTSQFDLPLCVGGEVEYSVGGSLKKVRINRIHLEEDAGKLMHMDGYTMVDYNRCGVPLIEIVTEPDMHSAEEAIAFVTELKSILKYIGVSDCKMQEGSIRCDVNLSVSNNEVLGTRTETKNLNSFRSIERSITYEIARQTKILASGGKVEQETRRWDDARGEGYCMRSKEDAHDYRYFPEPDLLPVVYSDEDISKIKASLPMLARERLTKYVDEYKLSMYDAQILTSDIAIAELFDSVTKVFNNYKRVSNFIMGDVLRRMKDDKSDDVEILVSAKQVIDILKMVDGGEISIVSASKALDDMWGTSQKASDVVSKLGLIQVSDESGIEEILLSIIEANPKVVADYKAGNDKVKAFFVGQTMKASKGKANPAVVNKVLEKLLR